MSDGSAKVFPVSCRSVTYGQPRHTSEQVSAGINTVPPRSMTRVGGMKTLNWMGGGEKNEICANYYTRV